MPLNPVKIESFHPELDRIALSDLARRLESSRFAPQPNTDSWVRGTPSRWLEELIVDWCAFDTTEFQSRLDQFDHFCADIEGAAVHLVLQAGNGPAPLPLLLTHGWPGSFLEYLKVLPLLTDPGAHGGDPADAFTVVVPSLPGFGFSSAPPAGGYTPREVADLWHRLMVEGLGFERYVAHGDDFGAGITAHLARRYPEEVAAVHLAPPGLPAPPKPWSEAESRHFQEVDAWFAEEGGYRHMHATKPSTLGAALSDSPVGLAAWIGEKVRSWASTRPDGESAFDRNLLLSTLTLYWVTNTIASSILLYWANGDAPQNALLADDPGPTPTTVSIFGGEAVKFPNVPRELGDRYYTVHHWAEYERGGHFPAVAEPELLVGILRDAFRPLRQRG